MEVKQIVNQFRQTIIIYDIPYDKIVITPYLNGSNSSVTMLNDIYVADYVSCDERSVKIMSKQVAKDIHVKYKEV